MSETPYPCPSSESASKVMRGNRRRDTTPELRLRRELHRRGLRYRVDFRVPSLDVITRPDLVFTRAKVAVYVDGCFWHGCPTHGTSPKANSSYWTPKIARNRARDERNTTKLRGAGWTVVRAWEHDDPVAVADLIETLVVAERFAGGT